MQRILTFLSSLRPKNKRSLVILFLLSLILIIAFVLRFAAFDHPIAANGGEGFRDLLVAKHMFVYGELPIEGHHNGLSTIPNSPLYYYLVAALALLSSTFLDTGLMYILFQCLFIIMVFFLTRAIFNVQAALIAALLLAISPHYIVDVTAFFVWPPYFVAPFVVASFLFLWFGYKKRKKILIGVSPIVMLLGLAVHQSVIAIIPLYGALVLYTAYKSSFSIKNYAASFLAFILAASALFVPPFMGIDISSIEWGARLESQSPTSSITGISQSVVSIPYAFGLYSDSPSVTAELTIMFIFLLFLWFYNSRAFLFKKRKYITLALLFLFSEIAVAVIFDPEGIPRHFEPVLWIVPVLLGALITAPFGRSLFVSLLSTVTVLLLVFSALTDYRLVHMYPNIGTFERPLYERMDSATDAMIQEIESIKQKENFESYSFFNIYAFGNTNFYVSPLIFWFELENKIGIQFEKSPNRVTRSFQSNHSDQYIFYACVKHRDAYTSKQCLKDFEDFRPGHSIQKQVFSSIDVNIYLAVENSVMQ